MIALLAGLTANATSKADPLIFTDSTHNELKVAYANKDLPAVALKYAVIESDKFCSQFKAHTNNEWSICKTAVEGQILAQKMIHLADVASEQDYDASREVAGRY
jgi:hypothetical protein